MPLPIEEILEEAQRGAVVLTVNKRLSRSLRRHFDQRAIEEGRTVWTSPQILPLEAWLHKTAGVLDHQGRILSRRQALHIWERIIAEDRASREHPLLQLEETASTAFSAHELLLDYQGALPSDVMGDDQQAFARWRRTWLGSCGERGWLDPADIPSWIRTQVVSGRLSAPQRLALVGFDEIPPAVRSLFEELGKRGCSVREFPPGAAAPHGGKVVEAEDLPAEVRLCARWVRGHLPKKESLGVVVFGLDRYVPLIERIFSEELNPAAALSPEGKDGIFGFSLGTPLRQEGLVAAALSILGTGYELTSSEAGYLLRSPFLLGWSREKGSRALLEADLRRRGGCRLTLDRLLEMTAGGSHPCPELKTFLLGHKKALSDSSTLHPGSWAKVFSRQLQDLGWPGDSPLSSRDVQVLRTFRETMAEMATLDQVASPMGRREALKLLRRLSADRVFQVEATQGPVQILGPLEAAGLQCDRLWIMGVHEDAVPAASRPNPFLPLGLQKALEMPHASAARELQYAQQVLERLVAGAPEVWISFPGQVEGTPVRPSPLLNGLKRSMPPLAPPNNPHYLLSRSATTLERLEDHQAPPLAMESSVAGGTAILSDQALCPFRAFAHHRLGARGLEEPSVGLSPLVRGTLVHGTLEAFWSQTADSSALMDLEEEDLVKRLAKGAGEALAAWERRQGCPIPPELRSLELKRLIELSQQWLSLERERPPFRVVATEREGEERIGPLRLTTRIDRLDELEGGGEMVLDYKTGTPTLSDWIGERPTGPQLPIYAIGREGAKLQAVAFAQVGIEGCKFTGLGKGEGHPKGVSDVVQSRPLQKAGISTWDELLEGWRSALEKLASDFSSGQASVSPVDVKRACKYCDLHPLCRIAETDGIMPEETEA